MYLGDIQQYTCALEGEKEYLWKITMLSDENNGYEKGDLVSLYLPPHRIALLPKETL
jgi:hypothetical protein